MDLIEQAIIFAAKAHHGQMRKGSDTPYITHPFSVAMLLQKAGCTEEVIAAAILHDTLEDTATTYSELVEQFGNEVADLVQAASEPDKGASWEERKQQTIDSLKDRTLAEIQVIVGDKLHNLRSIRVDLEEHGEKVWSRFKRGKEKQHWYYRSIVKALEHRKQEFSLIGELKREVEKVFG